MHFWPRGLYGSALLIFLLTVGVRVAMILANRTYLDLHDGAEMTRAARSIAATGDIGAIFHKAAGPSAHVAPLYAYYRGFLIWAFGEQSRATRAIQMGLALFATAATFALLPVLGARLGLRPWTGSVAGLFLAAFPFYYRMETYGTWEIAHTPLLLVLLLLAALKVRERGEVSRSSAVGFGLFLGFAGLLNPTLLLVAALLGGAVLLAPSVNRQRIAASAAVAGVTAVLCLAPWTVRNYIELGGFVPVRGNLGLELQVGNNPEANGMTFGGDPDNHDGVLWHYHPYLNKPEQARYCQIGELAYGREKLHTALAWMQQHPGGFLELTGDRFWYYWFPSPEMWSVKKAWRRVNALSAWPVGFGALAGAVVLVWRRHPSRWFVVAALFGPALIYFVTHVDPRYRYPTWALSALVAVDFLLFVVDAVRSVPWPAQLAAWGQELRRWAPVRSA